MTPTPVITDWRGEYYANPDLLGAPVLVRNDVDVNFNWGTGSPDPSVPNDNFSVRWTRTLDFQNGMYRFSLRSDDGARVFIDDNLIIDEWHAAGAAPPIYTVNANLAAGQHTLRIEYYEAYGDAYVAFAYAPAP